MSVKSALKAVGRQMLRHFDFVVAGACLVFSLSSRPFLTSFETERLENAKQRFEEVHADAVAYGTAAGQPDSVLNDSRALNLFIYEQREKNDQTRSLSDEYRSARAQFSRAKDRYQMNSTMGYVFGGAFAALGVVTAAAGVNNRRQRRKEQGMDM